MAIQDWKFKKEDGGFMPTDGKHRMRIADAEVTESSKGNDMIKLVLEVNGFKATVWHFITFLPQYAEMTNRMLTQLFDSFGIEEGNFAVNEWVGLVGAGVIKQDEEGRAKVSYFLPKDKQKDLAPWKVQDGQTPLFGEVGEDDVPF